MDVNTKDELYNIIGERGIVNIINGYYEDLLLLDKTKLLNRDIKNNVCHFISYENKLNSILIIHNDKEHIYMDFKIREFKRYNTDRTFFNKIKSLFVYKCYVNSDNNVNISSSRYIDLN